MICRAMMVAGLVVALCAVAQADKARERTAPIGTRITWEFPDGDRVVETVEDQPMLNLHESTAARMRKAERSVPGLERGWADCAADAAKLRPSPFWNAAKWTGVGVLVALSALGVAAVAGAF